MVEINTTPIVCGLIAHNYANINEQSMPKYKVPMPCIGIVIDNQQNALLSECVMQCRVESEVVSV